MESIILNLVPTRPAEANGNGMIEIKCIDHISGTQIIRQIGVTNAREVIDVLRRVPRNVDSKNDNPTINYNLLENLEKLPFRQMYSKESNGSGIHPNPIYFVLGSGFTVDTCPPSLYVAYEDCLAESVKCEWIDESVCLLQTPVEGDLYVVEPFVGNYFEYLVSFQNNGTRFNILGPQCVRYYIQHNYVIKTFDGPISNFSLLGADITLSERFSGVTRAHLQARVTWMAGSVEHHYSSMTSHVVVPDMMDDFSPLCVADGKPIMPPTWIDCLWQDGESDVINYKHPKYTKMSCPVFFNVYISLSQINKEYQKELQTMVKTYGGKITRELCKGLTQILVLLEDASLKCDYAKAWGIPCVVSEWIPLSLEAGYPLPVYNFSPEWNPIIPGAQPAFWADDTRTTIPCSSDEDADGENIHFESKLTVPSTLAKHDILKSLDMESEKNDPSFQNENNSDMNQDCFSSENVVLLGSDMEQDDSFHTISLIIPESDNEQVEMEYSSETEIIPESDVEQEDLSSENDTIPESDVEQEDLSSENDILSESDNEQLKGAKTNRRRPRVVFCCTRLSKDQLAVVNVVAKLFNGTRIDEYDESVTHLIYNDSSSILSLPTLKFLLALADNKLILSFEWVRQCNIHQMLIGENPYDFVLCKLRTKRPADHLLTRNIFNRLCFIFKGYDDEIWGFAKVKDWKKLLVKLGGSIVEEHERKIKYDAEFAVVEKLNLMHQRWIFETFNCIEVPLDWIVACLMSNTVLKFKK